MEALQTGIILKTVGLKGEMKLKSTTYYAEERYKKGNTLYLSKDGKNFEKFSVKSYRNYQGFDYVTLKEIDSIELAEKYVGFAAFIDKNKNKLEDGQFYFSDLENCKVIDFETKKELGSVKSVEEFPAQITLAVLNKDTKKIFYVPFLDAFIKNVDITKKEIEIKVIEGLVE